MRAPADGPAFNLFPVRLRCLHIHNMKFQANIMPEAMVPEQAEIAFSPNWSVSVTSTMEKDSAIVISVVKSDFSAKKTESKAGASEDASASTSFVPYVLEIGAVAGFTFTPDEQPLAEVKRWCDRGSFFIVLPFLRNAVAQLTRESGFPEILLPMLEVPTFAAPRRKDGPKRPNAATAVPSGPQTDAAKQH